VGRVGGYLSEIFASWQGEGALVGQRHLFVRTAGCNIRCTYCDTPDSLERVPWCRVDWPDGSTERLDNPITPERLAEIVERFRQADPALRMIAVTGGEPMVQRRFLAAWLQDHAPALKCLLETNAMLGADMTGLLERFAVVSADIKLPSNSGERPIWEQHERFLAACRDAGTEVYVKMPVDASTDPEEIRRAARLLAATAPGATLYVQPVVEPDSGRWRIDMAGLEAAAMLAAEHVPDTRVLAQVHKLMGVR
jgi:7-carboxy-7-deazaguanine synthase